MSLRPGLHRFFHLTLRTVDVLAARAFYGAVLGVGSARIDVVSLPPTALARGAKPHWLGLIEVDNVSAAVTGFVERGATVLSPLQENSQCAEATVLRDPGGAIVALAKPKVSGAPIAFPETGWYGFNTQDVERAKDNYGALFGWHFEAPTTVEGLGTFDPFAFRKGEPAVGSMRDVSAHADAHPHWLFHFRVISIEVAVKAVRDNGGLVSGEMTLPQGTRVAWCDDAQGAAFALWQSK